MSLVVEFPLRLGRGQNDRPGHWSRKHRAAKAEKATARWFLNGRKRPALPCVVTITRMSPGTGLDDDNLSAACKAVRDGVAEWLGVDDKHADIVEYRYAQVRGPWGVVISMEPKA